ncbi:DUF4129 domain-containing protein [Gilvimarinus sp. F26214L]|uniref:DUF4129 domain-containing protein n=1 Tax=Gilvimarinus sp. DZF01 TaxID=3461371 RepID=UPI0040464423
MDLAKLSFEPRPRNGWQAIDLGFAMARRWWWPAFLSWALPALVLYLLLVPVVPERPWICIFAVWWLKPLLDRLPLFIASRALFGEEPQARSAWRRLFGLFKTDWLPALTWRRFSPSRSFDLPVTVLEGLRGETRSRRLTVLHQRYGNAAFWLTLLLVHVEFFLAFGLWAALALLIPEQFAVDWLALMLGEGALATHLSNAITIFAMSLVAPFYAIGGFALYICRRVALEGWDIELRFRHLAERYRRPPSSSGYKAAAVLPLVFGLMSVGDIQHASAASADPMEVYYDELESSSQAQESKQQILEIYGGRDFHNFETESGWRFRDREPEEQAEAPDWIEALADFLEVSSTARNTFATGFEWLVWVLLAAIVGWLVYRYRRGLMAALGRGRSSAKNRQMPEVLFGLDVRKESLPKNVCEQVLEHWNLGRHREALGLLYRATLSHLIHQCSCNFRPGHTEQECVAIVARTEDHTLSSYLGRLTVLWQQLAYAHRVPDGRQVRRLCDEWTQLFGEQGHEA